MKNESLYNKTIGILVKAYQEDTLRHGHCTACAVGNICGGGDKWAEKFFTTIDDSRFEFSGYKVLRSKNGYIQVVREITYNIEKFNDFIDRTGYTWQELADIEFAFETADKGQSDDDWMFNGLMDVVDVLNRIHEVENKELSEELFVRL